MKISLITICYNEETLMPFFLRHYKNIVDEIFIFDNCSTDRSVEIASQCPKVRIKKFDTGGLLRDDLHLQFKNTFYKTLDADWIIAIDLDEFVYHKDLRGLLVDYMNKGVTFPKIIGYNMIGTAIPKDDGITPITDIINMGVRTDNCDHVLGPSFIGDYSKRAIFRKYIDINYKPGCHECLPKGQIVESSSAEILLLHYKWLSREYGVKLYGSWKLSPENLKAGWGTVHINTKLAYYDNALKSRTRVI